MRVCDICKEIGKAVIGTITLRVRQDEEIRDFCGDCKQEATNIIQEMRDRAKPKPKAQQDITQKNFVQKKKPSKKKRKGK